MDSFWCSGKFEQFTKLEHKPIQIFQFDPRGKSQRSRQPEATNISYQGGKHGNERILCTTESFADHKALYFGTQTVPIVVVGTKSDLVNEREVQLSTISNLSQRWNLPFFETSAKRNWHVNDVFEDLVRQMRNRYPLDPIKAKKKTHRQCIIM